MHTDIDLRNVKKIHIIGIEGAGTSALARLLKEMKKEVVGSDEGDHFYYDVLQEADIEVFHKFDANNIGDADMVIHSTSCSPETNEELKKALDSDIRTMTYPEVLGLVFNQKFGIAVCGTHGKTTTAAMLALAMKDAGADPTAIIGSKVKQLGGGAMIGGSEYFIIEADEYQNKLKHYKPMAVVLTSVDYDHPDFFKTTEDYLEVFRTFIRKIPAHGFLVACGDDAEVIKIAEEARCQIIFYGKFDYKSENGLIDDFEELGKKVSVIKTPKDLELKVPGEHNLLNATAALAVAKKIGSDERKTKESLSKFEGTARRFEKRGQRNGAEIIDDYAHHPEEVKATLKAAREKYSDKKITVVFHPHTFTRTKALLGEFAQSFENADKVFVLDIFGSAREKKGDVHSKDLVEKMQIYMKDVDYIPTIDDAFNELKDKLNSKDVLITMGAGDVWKLADKLVNKK